VAERSEARVCGNSLAVIGLFVSRRGHWCLSLVNVACYQVEVSATGRSLVQRSSTVCAGSLSVTQCNINPLHLLSGRGRKVWTQKINWITSTASIHTLSYRTKHPKPASDS
jgi:hypothetical protein